MNNIDIKNAVDELFYGIYASDKFTLESAKDFILSSSKDNIIKSSLIEPDIIIFRLDDDKFVSIDIDFNKKTINKRGEIFSVCPDDSYLEMTYDSIVLAKKTSDGSHSLGIYFINEEESGTEVVVNKIEFDDLKEIVFYLVDDYIKGEK